MGSNKRAWQVLDEDTGVIVQTYLFSGSGTSNSFVAGIGDGKLAVFSPCVGLTDDEAAELDAFGEVAAIVAPNGFHHLGQKEWRARYPNARCFAAPEAAARIAKKSPGLGPFEPMCEFVATSGPTLTVRESPGTRCGETWAWVDTEQGNIWYVSDLMCNWDRFPGNFVFNALWKLTKSGPGLSVFHLAMLPIIKDKKLVLRTMLEDLQAHPPSMIVMAHGAVIVDPEIVAKATPVIAAAAG